MSVARLLVEWTYPSTAAAEAFLNEAALDVDGYAIADANALLAELEDRAAGRDAGAPLPGAATPTEVRRAERYLQAHSLHEWVRKQNLEKGLAPTTRLVQSRVFQEATAEPSGQAAAARPEGRRVSTKWVQRFCRAWRLRRGSYAPRETLPQDVLLSRVPGLAKRTARGCLFLFFCVFGGPNSGSGKRLPIWGPRYLSLSSGGFGKRTLFRDLRIAELARQALHAWAWWNLYEESVPEGQRLLAINMDETAIRFFVQHRGLCTRRARHGRDPIATQQVSRKDMRACLTHVAFACADAGVQRVLPQIFIGNEHVLRVSDVAALAPRFAANVTILRRQSAWVNTPLMVQIMHALGSALRACTEGMQLVLLMDAHHVHLAAPVLRAAASWGIWVLPLPAKTTWLLQPLDTHIFSAYKAAMRR